MVIIEYHTGIFEIHKFSHEGWIPRDIEVIIKGSTISNIVDTMIKYHIDINKLTVDSLTIKYRDESDIHGDIVVLNRQLGADIYSRLRNDILELYMSDSRIVATCVKEELWK